MLSGPASFNARRVYFTKAGEGARTSKAAGMDLSFTKSYLLWKNAYDHDIWLF